jgi:bla regulator protein blaR1
VIANLLVDAALRVTIILAAGLVVTLAMPRAAAATRHVAWTLAVTGALMVPLLTFALPSLRVLPPARAEALALQEKSTAVAQGLQPSRSDPESRPADRGSFMSGRSTSAVLTSVWALVAALLLLRLVAGFLAVRRLTRHAAPADARWRALLEQCAASAGVTRAVRLLVSDDVAMPMTWAGRLLLIPRAAQHWSGDRARAVLLHELAHIDRADWLTHACSGTLVALHWFNPLAWVAAARMTRERERACDDRVLAQGTSACEYATHLLEIARQAVSHEASQSLACTVAPAMARRSELEGRLLSILTARARRSSRVASRLLVSSTVVLIAAIASAAQRPAPASAPVQRPRVMAAVQQTAERPEAPLAPIIEALEDEDEGVREEAAMSLALRSGPDVVEPLLAALSDSSSQVREKAAIGLAMRTDPRVVDALLDAASDPDSQVREKVIIALGMSGDGRALLAIIAAVKDPDSQVREKAVAALALSRPIRR